MNQTELLIEKINILVNIINKNSKQPRDYGIGFALYASEIHMLCSIASHPNSNADSLSELLNITNGAVHKTTSKLISKNLIVPYNKQGNNKSIYYSLTDLGKKAIEGHAIYHKSLSKNVESLLENSSSQNYTIVLQFLDKLIDGLK